jgi:hypothetical protein
VGELALRPRVHPAPRRVFPSPSAVLARAAAASGAQPGETVALTGWIAACWLSPTGEPGPVVEAGVGATAGSWPTARRHAAACNRGADDRHTARRGVS